MNNSPSDYQVQIFNDVFAEIWRAMKKHPEWPKDLIHRAAIVGEESGELIRACLQHEYEKKDIGEIKKEAIQTAAMAMRFLFAMHEDGTYNKK